MYHGISDLRTISRYGESFDPHRSSVTAEYTEPLFLATYGAISLSVFDSQVRSNILADKMRGRQQAGQNQHIWEE